MKKVSKVAAIALAASLAVTALSAPAANAATCTTKTKVTMLGTIKIEIQDQFLAAVKEYNESQTCYTVESITSDRNLTFLQNVTPMYAAKKAPTIMTTLQEIPDMADKVMDWKGSKLAGLAPKSLLEGAKVAGKQVGVPATVEAFGLLYNKTVLDKAKVDPKKIKTRADLEAAFKKVEASGAKAMRFSALWWSLGAHLHNLYFTNAGEQHESRLRVLDGLANGTKKLSSDPVWQNWIATYDLMKKYNNTKPNLTDTEYDRAVADLSRGKVGFWFMGNWAEPNLIAAAKTTKFGIMPLPISNNAKAYGNDSISVGVPFYFIVDKEQSTEAERAGAVDFLNWLMTTPAGQKRVAGPISQNGMNFIPAYKGFKVQPETFMAKEIASYVNAGKTLEWMNSYFPAGGQNLYGASSQKYMTGKINAAQYATELEKAWKGKTKTWRGAAK
jgi:raffinose/stachyose/melibiose transport system substrate-binding protein